MATSDVSLPSDVFVLKGDRFYAFFESTFNVEIKEIARLQGFSSAYSLLYSDQHLLDFVQLDSKDPNLIAIKQMAAFYLKNDTWAIKPGIQYEVDSLMLALRRTQHAEASAIPEGAMLVSSDVLSYFPWLKALILLCQNSFLSKGPKRSTLSIIIHRKRGE